MKYVGMTHFNIYTLYYSTVKPHCHSYSTSQQLFYKLFIYCIFEKEQQVIETGKK